jgi:16S rRNA (cytosine967-C5)-methyltransferase
LKKENVSRPDRQKGSRELAAEILSAVEIRKAYADILLDNFLNRSSLSSPDRALLTQMVYGTLRWRGRIDWHLSQVLPRPLSRMNPYLRNLLRLTLYQLFFLSKIPSYAAVNEGVELAKRYGGAKAGSLINGVARRILREKHTLHLPDSKEDLIPALSINFSHPEWLVRIWLNYFGQEETEALLKANNDESPFTLRVNQIKATREALLARVTASGFDAVPTPWSPLGIRVKATAAVDQLPEFQVGAFQVQGEASQLVGFLLDPKPGERVLDACAAPGGKTTHLAELMRDQGEVIAVDISARGLEKVKENVQRLGLKSVRTVAADVSKGLEGSWGGPYDRILVDAPCTGLGTLRSHPEAKWHRQERDILRLSRLQKRIVQQVTPHLKPGGTLVYSTCTLAPDENEGVIDDLLDRHPELVLEDAESHLPQQARSMTRGKYFLALPHKHNTDGFFAARIKKAP